MTWLATTAVSNAVVATVLALFAYAIGRWSKNAAVSHALWILVLVKLVTPPLFDLPLPILPAWAAQIQADGSWRVATPVVEPSPLGEVVAASSPLETADRTISSTPHILGFAVTWLVRIWIGGIVLYSIYQMYITWQMCRLMRMAVPHPRIDRAMHRIAEAAQVKNYPTARVVPWVGSPMLWGLGGTSVIVLPDGLFASMEDETADTLLQHELAHFQRGDQWVRILEVLASTLFWWHPVVWLALHEIEIHEEQCCDAWVVNQNRANRRRYAEALLDTVDFIADAPETTLPLAASGLGRVPFLKQRLRSIMSGEQQVMSSRGRIAIAMMICAIPLQPRLLQARALYLPAVARISEQSDQVRLPKPEDVRSAVRTAPGMEYANATSTFGSYELIATSGYQVRLREALSGKSIDLSEKRISCAAFAPASINASPRFVAGSQLGQLMLFDCQTSTAQEIGTFAEPVQSVAYSNDGSRIAAGVGSTVRLFDLQRQSERVIPSLAGPVRCVRFSPGGDKLLLAIDTTWQIGQPGRIEIWDLATLSRERQIDCPAAVGVASFTSDGNVLSAEWDGTLRIWSENGEMLAKSQTPKDLVSAVSFSPNAGQDMLESFFASN